MRIFHLFMLASVAYTIHLITTASLPNFTTISSTTPTDAAQRPITTTWLDRSHIIPLMDYPDKMLCMIPNYYADHRISILNGINYLNSHGDSAVLGPGPGNCSRVSCADDSGIYVCNDNPYTIAVDLHTVANFTYAIYSNESCVDPTSYGGNTQGQAFSSYGWNTIVGQLVGEGWC